MFSFTRLTSSKGPALFEIRLENDFIVFRGTEDESSPQLLKGTVVLCLTQSLKLEDITLKLTGVLNLSWTDQRISSTGVTNHRVNHTTPIYSHKWPHLTDLPTRANDPTRPRCTTLEPGNYEYPFELMLPGNLTESVEGLREGSIMYNLKATISRGKLFPDLSVSKRLRIIRTLDPSSLGFIDGERVENIWTNKMEYSITTHQRAVVFGTSISLEARFTPLLKGLELGDVKIRLFEYQRIMPPPGRHAKEFKRDKEVGSWTVSINRDEHWQDMIEDTGQEGWVMKKVLDLPRKLGKCLQNVNSNGIHVRHMLKVDVVLKNPDGHLSELRVKLPATIFISPNMPLDEDGELVRQLPQGATASQSAAVNALAPPVYGEHILDQLYDDMDPTGLQTPASRSGATTPAFGHSRSGSVDNLQALSFGITPAALTHRLQNVSLERSNRSQSFNSLTALGESAAVGMNSGPSGSRHQVDSTHSSPAVTAPLSRHNSGDHLAPEHIDNIAAPDLSKVPSYQTAVKTPIRQLSYQDGYFPPNYDIASTAQSSVQNSRANSPPGSPEPSPRDLIATHADIGEHLAVESLSNEPSRSASLEVIEEVPPEVSAHNNEQTPSPPERGRGVHCGSPAFRIHSPPMSPRSTMGSTRRSSFGLSLSGFAHNLDDQGRRLALLRMREGAH